MPELSRYVAGKPAGMLRIMGIGTTGHVTAPGT